MAVALATVKHSPDLRRRIVDVTLDGSYAAGGYALTASQLGVLTIDNINASMVSGHGFVPQWVSSTGKLKVYKSAGSAAALTECANTDLSTSNVVRCEVIGPPVL